jgi:hypothetical protein
MRRRAVSVWRRRLVNYALILAAASTSMLVYVAMLSSAVTNKPAEVYLWSRPEEAAAIWLGSHTTAADVVLASTDFANPLVGVIDGRVVHGHIVATLHSDDKRALVARFFGSDTAVTDRTRIVEQSHATWVALGPRERGLGASDLSTQPGLALMYDQNGVQLFRVQS